MVPKMEKCLGVSISIATEKFFPQLKAFVKFLLESSLSLKDQAWGDWGQLFICRLSLFRHWN